jgi:peptidoglycan/LPS O-acetylase OafA/YrhL
MGVVGSVENNVPRTLAMIEAGRGIAASLVVLYHAARHVDRAFGAPLLSSIFQFGHAGVDFFFVISGFIILFVHYGDVGNPVRLTRYAVRRFTRLMPTYWVALTLTATLAIAGTHGAPSISDLLWSASLLPSNRELVLGIAWTLQFEILFYALFSILIVRRTAGLIVMAGWLSMTVIAALISFNASWLPVQFYGAYNLEFFLGMAVAYVLKNHTVPRARLLAILGVVLFGAVAVLEDVRLLDGYGNFARLAYGIPASLIVLGIAEADRQKLLSVPAYFRMLGAASYSIYLFQFIFIGMLWQVLLVTRLQQGLPVIAQFTVLAAAGIIGGGGVSIWVERPLIRMIRSRLPTARSAPPKPTAERYGAG